MFIAWVDQYGYSKLIGSKINFVQTVSVALRARLPDIDKSIATAK
jgi:hypothetical protein